MSAQLLQYLLSGLTVGAIYALVALGFSIIYNASQVINFAQGEFVMIGGMATVSLVGIGLPLPLAAVIAIAATTLVGLALDKLAVERARGASVVTLIIITIGASILLRGLASLVWDKNLHALPAFSGERPIAIGGATILPQSLWVHCGGSSSARCSARPCSPPRTTGSPRSSSASACGACCSYPSACRRRSAHSPASSSPRSRSRPGTWESCSV
jgi:branched-chain amino acid transport system permease protein